MLRQAYANVPWGSVGAGAAMSGRPLALPSASSFATVGGGGGGGAYSGFPAAAPPPTHMMAYGPTGLPMSVPMPMPMPMPYMMPSSPPPSSSASTGNMVSVEALGPILAAAMAASRGSTESAYHVGGAAHRTGPSAGPNLTNPSSTNSVMTHNGRTVTSADEAAPFEASEASEASGASGTSGLTTSLPSSAGNQGNTAFTAIRLASKQEDAMRTSHRALEEVRDTRQALRIAFVVGIAFLVILLVLVSLALARASATARSVQDLAASWMSMNAAAAAATNGGGGRGLMAPQTSFQGGWANVGGGGGSFYR